MIIVADHFTGEKNPKIRTQLHKFVRRTKLKMQQFYSGIHISHTNYIYIEKHCNCNSENHYI